MSEVKNSERKALNGWWASVGKIAITAIDVDAIKTFFFICEQNPFDTTDSESFYVRQTWSSLCSFALSYFKIAWKK